MYLKVFINTFEFYVDWPGTKVYVCVFYDLVVLG